MDTRRPQGAFGRPVEGQRLLVKRSLSLFYNVCVLCGTSVVVALTVKVIMSLFN